MDVDGDDLPEIFFASNAGKLYRINPDGQEVGSSIWARRRPERLPERILGTVL